MGEAEPGSRWEAEWDKLKGQPQGRARAHDARPSRQPYRRPPALELESLKRRKLTDVREMDAYELSGWITEPPYGPPQLQFEGLQPPLFC